jgi:hypothetical protein
LLSLSKNILLNMVGNLLNPGLFGLEFTNRDFTKSKYWGKNQFNSSFPASLACYMHSIGINPVYLSLDLDRSVRHSKISLENLFGLPPLTDRLHFAFETVFSPYATYAKGTVPRADLVTIDRSFDLFVWSDFGFTRLFTKTARLENAKGITRNARSVVWLYKMLSDFAANGAIDFKGIIDYLR